MLEKQVRNRIEDLIKRAGELNPPGGLARNSREVSLCEAWITEASHIIELAVRDPNNAYRRNVERLAGHRHSLVQTVHSISAVLVALLRDIDSGLLSDDEAPRYQGDPLSGDFANFRAVYDDLTDQVLRSTYVMLPDHLRNLFERIDATPGIAAIVGTLQKLADFESWFAAIELTGRMGLRGLEFPKDKDEKLAMGLLLFRAASQGKVDLGWLGFQFLAAGSNKNESTRIVLEQVFRPMASELRRYLADALSGAATVRVPPQPTASTAPKNIALEARSTTRVGASLDFSVNRASANLGGAAGSFAKQLSEQPADIAASARNLSRALTEQIEELNASKPNDPDRLTQQNDFVAFLQNISAGLIDLADSLEKALAASAQGTPEPMLLGKAGDIARQLGAAASAGLDRHRVFITDCAIRFSVFGAGFLFLSACGVNGYIAGIVATLMNIKLQKGE